MEATNTSPASGSATSAIHGNSTDGNGGNGHGHVSPAVALIYRVDWILLVLFAAFTLAMIPRLLTTLSRPAHFFTLYLRRPSHNEYTDTPAREYGNERQTNTPETVKVQDKAGSFDQSISDPSLRSSVLETAIGAPCRVRSLSTYMHPAMVSALNRLVWSGITVAKAVVLSVYFALLLYAGFNDSNVFSDPRRTGYIALSQIPIVVSLAAKNNALSWLSGEGYEKLNYIHRFGGLMAVLATNLHGIGYTYKWAQNGQFRRHLEASKYKNGFAAWAAMDILLVGSLPIVRRKSYTFFLTSHIVGFGILLGTLYNHFPVTWNYIYATIAIYGLDLLLRTLRTRATTAYVTAHPHLNSGTTAVHLPKITKGFRPGQHVRVRFVDPNAGALGWIMAVIFARTRPFSISSRPGASGLELLIKNEGSSTRNLFNMAKGKPQTVDEKTAGVELGPIETRRVKVLVEGPYGGPSATMFEAFSGALLVAGGSGVSFILSILDDLVSKHVEGRARTRVIEVVWSVGDIGSFLELLPTLRPLLRPRLSPEGELLSVHMTVHHTKATRFSLPEASELPDGLHVRAGRPDLLESLSTTIDCTLGVMPADNRLGAQGVIAACCGPPALGEHLNRAVGGLNYSLWKQVGGVETVTETFGW